MCRRANLLYKAICSGGLLLHDKENSAFQANDKSTHMPAAFKVFDIQRAKCITFYSFESKTSSIKAVMYYRVAIQLALHILFELHGS